MRIKAFRPFREMIKTYIVYIILQLNDIFTINCDDISWGGCPPMKISISLKWT